MTAPSAHPTDDDLILRFYGEDDAALRAEADAHLTACAACQDRWAMLVRTLALVSAAEPPAADAGFDERLWRAVADGLAPRRTVRSGRTWAMVASWAAVVAIMAAVTYRVRVPPQSPGATATPTTASATTAGARSHARERVL